MKLSIYHRLSRILWGAIVVTIVLLAVYVSLGRMLSPLSESFQQEILQELNQRVPFTIDANRVSAEWHAFTPSLVLNGLRVTIPGETARPLELSEGRIALDVGASLLSGTLQMTDLRLNGLNLAGELGEDGRLRISGFGGGGSLFGGWLEDFLLNLERVAMSNTHLELLLPGGERRGFDLDLILTREGSHRYLEGMLLSSLGQEVFLRGEGVGNPFSPDSFSGELYLDIDLADTGAVADLLPESLRTVRVDGSLGLELWSSWDLGKSATSLRLRMGDVLLAARDASWQVPFDWVAFEASLVDREGGWGLSVAALELAQGQVQLQVPRLQLDISGQTFDLRSSSLSLGPLADLLSGIDSLPAPAVGLLDTLRPRGDLAKLQVSVADIGSPSTDWKLLANFDELAVDPWRGAPGINGARGYVELGPGSGLVVLDSQRFSMAFPAVYKAPLHYEDFHGTIHIDWDDEAVVLSSGLVEATDKEGKAPVLFGLNIPLEQSDAGIEMDLLVGLPNKHPRQRSKYIPYILNEGLLSWLESSVGEGLIERGGFLWRGSLKPGAAPLRTVQLFFVLRDTALAYHPDWPSLVVDQGTVLIDDTNVSVWADSASLLDSVVSDLSVEVWADRAGELWLAVDAGMVGSAADGLAVVNDSPIGGLAGNVFSEWQLKGELVTDLDLLLNLRDSSVAPQVEVSARFDTVDLDIQPGKVPLREINGVLDYSTAGGFRSLALVGKLWGRPLQIAVSQPPAPAGTGPAAVAVEFASTVDMDDLRQWLAPGLPDLARGQTAVTAKLVVGPGSAPGSDVVSSPEPAVAGLPVLTIHSDLTGVSLALPEPWNKPAEAERPLHLDISLGGESTGVGITLDGGLSARLEVQNGRVRSAALALDDEPGALEPGRVHISGRTAYADTGQWQRLLADYFAADPSPADEPEAAGTAPTLAVTIDDLQVDRLLAGGQDLGAVRFSLADEGDQWRLQARTDWLRGELVYIADGVSRLDISHLELEGLEGLGELGGEIPAPPDEDRIVEVPDMAVTIGEVRRADTVLGELAFDLRSEDTDLFVQNIIGRIATLELRAEKPGRLLWQQGPDSRTTLEASLFFEDLGRSLDLLGYQKVIETEEGLFELALDWPGGPQDFSLPHGRGSLRVEMGEGHFPEAPEGAKGTLRVINILNLGEIVQRLSLNQRFDSGIPFNDVKGEIYLHAGTIEVVNMNIQGPASGFQFSGISHIESQSLNGELVVTVPVAPNLPWVAALTAGLPVAAGVYVLSKVFETPLNRLTSAVYSTTGTWDDPKVEFDRVFDNTASDGAGAPLEGATPVVVPLSAQP